MDFVPVLGSRYFDPQQVELSWQRIFSDLNILYVWKYEMCVELSGGRQTRISKQLLDSQSSPRRLQIFHEMINPPTTLLNSHPNVTTRTFVLLYPTIYLTCPANGWQPVTVNSTPFWSSASKPSAGIPVARAAERVTHRGEVRGFGTGMSLHSLKSWLQPKKNCKCYERICNTQIKKYLRIFHIYCTFHVFSF